MQLDNQWVNMCSPSLSKQVCFCKLNLKKVLLVDVTPLQTTTQWKRQNLSFQTFTKQSREGTFLMLTLAEGIQTCHLNRPKEQFKTTDSQVIYRREIPLDLNISKDQQANQPTTIELQKRMLNCSLSSKSLTAILLQRSRLVNDCIAMFRERQNQWSNCFQTKKARIHRKKRLALMQFRRELSKLCRVESD